MGNIDPNEIKVIPKDRWPEWCTMFTFDYDPEGKGNRITLSFGSQESPGSHIINSPSKIIQMQNENGLVESIVIENKTGIRDVVMLK